MNICITDSTLTSIFKDSRVFEDNFAEYAREVSSKARLIPKIVPIRVKDAHAFWKEDLHRVGGAEPLLVNGLDHFKQCGHLAYWLRRTSPVVEFHDTSELYTEGTPGLNKDEVAFRDLMYKYGTEYMAFDWAFQICLFHEKTRPDKSERADSLVLSPDYIETMCHFLKRKNVSPHALFLIFRSLFQ